MWHCFPMAVLEGRAPAIVSASSLCDALTTHDDGHWLLRCSSTRDGTAQQHDTATRRPTRAAAAAHLARHRRSDELQLSTPTSSPRARRQLPPGEELALRIRRAATTAPRAPVSDVDRLLARAGRLGISEQSALVEGLCRGWRDARCEGELRNVASLCRGWADESRRTPGGQSGAVSAWLAGGRSHV